MLHYEISRTAHAFKLHHLESTTPTIEFKIVKKMQFKSLSLSFFRLHSVQAISFKKLFLAIIISVLVSACSSSSSTTAEPTASSGSTAGETTTNNTDNAGNPTTSVDGGINTEGNEGSSDNAGTDTQPSTGETTTGGDTTDGGNTPVANLTKSATLPTISDDQQVSWSFAATPSGLEVHIQPFVEMPLASNGQPARWNDLSSFGDRLFAVDEQDGRVYEITDRRATLWFDISNAVQSQTGRALDISNTFHGGVRGIAFHPDFATNGKFYASLMEQRPDNTELHKYISDDSAIDADGVLVEWTADTTTYTIEPASYREVFRVGVPQYDHPIKQIAFNQNTNAGESDFGHLYIAHGDGSIASTLAGTGLGNNALGKIMRIDPLQGGSENYSIPADNPFISDTSLPAEVFSYGHRNPHHLAFSKDGHLMTTEAGRDNIEEVNLVENGQNYGWSQREGAYVHLDTGNLGAGISALPEDDAINGFTYPVVQFGHTGSLGTEFTGQSLGGGHVVENGSPLDGQFFYIDFPKSGILFHSALDDMLQANTKGAPETLSSAQSFIATVKFDHDSNPDTAALDNDLKQIVQSASGYVNLNDRVDVRIEQGPNGIMYMMSKRNNMIYLVTSSLPGGPTSNAARP